MIDSTGQQPGEKVLVVLLSAETDVARLVERECRDRGIATVFLAAEYDYVDGEAFSCLPLKLPMDYVQPESLEALYHAVYDWQEGLAASPLSDGTALEAASSPEGFEPALPGWILRLASHYHVRARFIEMISGALDAEAPTLVCPVGESRYQTWNVTLLERIVAQREGIHLVPAASLVPYPAQWKLAAAAAASAAVATPASNANGRERVLEQLEDQVEVFKAKRLEIRRDVMRRTKQARRDLRAISKEKRQAIGAQTRALELNTHRLTRTQESLEKIHGALAARAGDSAGLAAAIAECDRLLNDQRKLAKEIGRSLAKCIEILEQLRAEATPRAAGRGIPGEDRGGAHGS